MKKPVIMLDLNELSSFGGPYITAKRIATSELNNYFEFVFLKHGNDGKSNFSITRLKSLILQIKEKKPDIIHFSGLQASGFLIALSCFLTRNPRSLMTIRGTSADALDLVWYKKLLMTYLFEPLTCLLVNKFYCNSMYTQRRAISRIFSYKRFPYIYNYWAGNSSNSTVNLSRQNIGLSIDDIVVISTGRITYDKGFGLYCDIVDLVLKKISSVKFLLVGDGKYLETLKFRLGEHIFSKKLICLGFRKDIRQLNLLADLYLNPSLHETLSVSTLEAMSAGLPSVVSNNGGLKELVIEGKTGFKCDMHLPTCYVEKLIKLISSKDLRLKMGRSAKIRCINAMSEKKITKQLKQIYERLLSDFKV